MTNVHILATLNTPSLLHYSELVFDTLRVGFPTANVTVDINGADGTHDMSSIREQALAQGCIIRETGRTIHHEWIQRLIMESNGDPFWIVDTDMIFYDNVEDWSFTGATEQGPGEFGCAIAGYLVPEFEDEFTNSTTRSRLHTSLMYINPSVLRKKVARYAAKFPKTEFNPLSNLIYPQCLPFNGEGIFYDTCSMLYHAIGGQPFTDEQKDAYFHFHFGTLAYMVLPRLSDGDQMKKVRTGVLENPDRGRGLWRAQDEYYASRQPVSDGVDVIAAIDPKDASDAQQWNIELCRGNRDAMIFCDLWYNYCHGIDDLIDTLRDGRPLMSKEQMISLFFKAAILYNSPFFVTNRDVLFPIILQVTNTYQDSVKWERSSKPHLRAMADVFRTCGNEMFVIVALLCGGEQHMRVMSQKIKERDWLGQHDVNGKPI